MNTFSNSFNAEVARVTRKELKPELQDIRKTLGAHSAELAAFRRELKALVSRTSLPQRPAKTAAAPPPAAPASQDSAPAGKARQPRFQAQALVKKRKALGISQKDMAKLLGASLNSVIRWESGRFQPRAAEQIERIAQVLKMAKGEVLDALHGTDFAARADQSEAAQQPMSAADVAPDQEPASRQAQPIQFQPETLLGKRKALGISRQDMAKLLGASLNSVIRWESGQNRPQTAQQTRIAEVLKMDKRQVLDALEQM